MTVDIDLNLGRKTSSNGQEVLFQNVRLTKAPHILVAGMTGGGKSVLVHHLLAQIITHNSPGEAALILIDPKRVEFGQYKRVPHLPLPPAYEEDHIEYALGWAVAEMEARFSEMEQRGWRDVTAMEAPWPRLIVVVDELANLILGGKHLEKPIVKIASMGRAAGVHLILATQRPSADVITGLIRANVPTRACLPVITKVESRIVLDEAGGEGLVNPGDMLLRLPGQRSLVGGYRCPNVTQVNINVAIEGAMSAYT
jgi:S-DNA-T family DNA segregation ATPase FtsK/SpoIIIE